MSGGRFSVKSWFLGVDAAAEVCKQQMESKAKGHYEGTAKGMPVGSGPVKWVEALLDSFGTAQQGKRDNAKAWESVFNAPVTPPVQPAFTEKPAKEPKMEPTRKDKLDDAIAEMKYRTFVDQYKKDHGGLTPVDPEWDFQRYLETLKEEANLNPQQINARARRPC